MKLIHLTDGSVHRIHLDNPECVKANECVCGLCKAEFSMRDGKRPQCDFGDCRNPATRNCAKFGYPICDHCAEINALIHKTAYAVDPAATVDRLLKDAAQAVSELYPDQSGGSDGGA